VPLYDYDCAACGRRFEVIHGLDDPAPEHCPLCGKGPVRKAFAAPAIHFKGSGWAKKERRAAAKSRGSSSDGDSSDTSEKRDTGDTSGESSKPADPASSSKGGSASTSTTTSRPAADTARSSD
jgi:putative FmdB family regulatory protein